MARAEFLPTFKAKKHKLAMLCELACLVVGASSVGPAYAQGLAEFVAPRTSPSDVRYTSTAAGDAALTPNAPGSNAPPAVVFRGEKSGANHAGNTAVARILLEIDRNDVPADGQSPVKVKVMLLDRDGKALTQATVVTIEHTGGRILLPDARTDGPALRGLDADRVTPGVQLKVSSGTGEFTLLAPAVPQEARVRVTSGSEEVQAVIRFVPEMRPLVAVGLAEAIIAFQNKPSLVQTRRSDSFDQEIENWSRQFDSGRNSAAARAALYVKGTVNNDTLLTASFDSDKSKRARQLRDAGLDDVYPVMGDASLRAFDAPSAQRLYLRLDKNKSYGLYGDYVTGDGFSEPVGQGIVASLKQRSLGNYNRSATGARLHHEEGALTGNVFAFRDSLRQVVEEMASRGSGPYGLSNNGVLEGSEKLEVLVRDRAQPARIIAVRALVRLVDYSFEPFSGRIVLLNFLPSVDDHLNPMSLRVTYEVDQGGSPFWVAGADAQWHLNSTIEVGGSAVSDRNSLAPYALVSGNLTARLAPRTALVVEAAESTSTVNTNPTNQATSAALATRSGEVRGKAVRAELAHETETVEARVSYGLSSPLFNNTAAPLNGGREEFYAKGAFKITNDSKAYGEALNSRDRNAGGGERALVGMGLRWAASERLTLDVGMRQQRETVGTQTNSSVNWPYGANLGLTSSLGSGAGGGAVGFGNQTVDPATGLPVVAQGAAPSAPSTPSSSASGTKLASTSVRAGAGYRVNDRATVGAEVEGSVAGDNRQRLALGADYTVAERTRLYGRYEQQRGGVDPAGALSTGRNPANLVLGVDSGYWRDNQLFSEYRLRDAFAGRDLLLASGARSNWDVAEGWRVSTAYENLHVVSGRTAASNAFSFAVDWSADPLWRASSKLELRISGDVANTPDNERFETKAWQAMLARKLDRDWTLLARNQLLRTDYAAKGGVLQDRAQLGLAYRDTETNRVNALGKVEYKTERDASNVALGDLSSRAWIISASGDYHASRPWWLTARLAGKWQNDVFEGGAPSRFASQLAAGRLVYDITEKWDLSALLAAQRGNQGARQTAYGIEVGYQLRQHLWLSAGANVAGFAGDADLTGYEYTRQGAYLRLRVKFDENLFKTEGIANIANIGKGEQSP